MEELGRAPPSSPTSVDLLHGLLSHQQWLMRLHVEHRLLRHCGEFDRFLLPLYLCSVTIEIVSGKRRSGKDYAPALLDRVDLATDSVDIDTIANSKTEPIGKQFPVLGTSECKCEMRLCICEAPAPSQDTFTLQSKTTSTCTVRSNSKPKKLDTTLKNRGSTSNKYCTIFTPGQVTSRCSEKSFQDYEVNEEGLREAIKNGDVVAVKKLLNQEVDANYCDKQGLTLLHLGKRHWIVLLPRCSTR